MERYLHQWLQYSEAATRIQASRLPMALDLESDGQLPTLRYRAGFTEKTWKPSSELWHSHQASSWSRLWGKEVGDKLAPRPSHLPLSRLTCTEYLLHTRPSIKYHPWVTSILMTTLGQVLELPSFHMCENEGLERSHSCLRSHTASKWQRQALNPGNWIPAPTHRTPHVSTSLKCGFSLWWVMVDSSHEFN